jgi:UDP-glucose 6-dehydrogenase
MSTSSEDYEAACRQRSTKVLEMPARQPNLVFSVEVGEFISEADLVFIAVSTPTKMRGKGAGCAMDMTAFEAVISELAQYARAETIIVEKSTVPCRTARLVQDIVSRTSLSCESSFILTQAFRWLFTGPESILKSSRTPSFWRPVRPWET